MTHSSVSKDSQKQHRLMEHFLREDFIVRILKIPVYVLKLFTSYVSTVVIPRMEPGPLLFSVHFLSMCPFQIFGNSVVGPINATSL